MDSLLPGAPGFPESPLVPWAPGGPITPVSPFMPVSPLLPEKSRSRGQAQEAGKPSRQISQTLVPPKLQTQTLGAPATWCPEVEDTVAAP